MIPTLKIAQVANGFIVYPPEGAKNNSGEATHVFQTFAELTYFLSDHFEHREYSVLLDKNGN